MYEEGKSKGEGQEREGRKEGGEREGGREGGKKHFGGKLEAVGCVDATAPRRR